MSFISPFTGDVVQPTDVSYRSITLTANTQLAWPINGNATGNYAARIMEVSASSAGLHLRMPPANQNSVGNDALIRNTGGNSFTVTDYNGLNTIITIAPGTAEYIYITDNPDAQGTWGIIAFGAGTANPDAATLAGYGLLAIANTLNQSHPAQSITNGYSFVSTDRAQVKVWSGGSGAGTLPSAAAVGNNWFCLFKNVGSGTFTINAAVGELIDYTISKTFQPDESAFLMSDGTSFITVGYGQSQNFFLSVLVKNVTGGTYNITASEASNVIQEYVGTLVANVVAVYPPAAQLYVISNQTVDNGYSLTITTGAVGAANIVVPAGNQVTVFCDGTNFYNANTIQAGASTFSLLNGTVSSPSLSFAAEPNSGMYRPGAGSIGITILGTNRATFTASGFNYNGSGTFTGGVTGGTF
jgi:hypothetical protein